MLYRISKITSVIIVAELCLGGGGRLISLGPISLRMVLYVLAIGLTLIHLFKGDRIPRNFAWLILFFIAFVIVGFFVAKINLNPKEAIWEDIKPLLYFLTLPFFYFSLDAVDTPIKIIKPTSVLLSLIFLSLLMLIHLGLLPFLTFYKITEPTHEFFYRGELSFFYKGFLFFGIGSIFFYCSESRLKYFFIVILVLAIVLSFTRGLLVALAITFTLYFFLQKKYTIVLTTTLFALIIVIWGNTGTMNLSRWIDSSSNEKDFNNSNPNLLGDRNYSDEGRITQTREVLSEVSLRSFFVGHGFGRGTLSRPVHMEISYMEIFHKQGLIGITFWFAVAATVILAYFQGDRSKEANAYFLSSIFVFIESVTNQYFNNPIGMSVILFALVSLHKMKA